MQPQTRPLLRKTAIDRDLDRAVQRVYENYGSDLGRFLAEVKRDQLHRLDESSEIRRDDSEKK